MYKLTYRRFEKRWADVFQIYPNAIRFNPLQFCPSTSRLVFLVFCSGSSIVLCRYFDILVNSMTIWSLQKLPKIAWPSSFKYQKSNVLWIKLTCFPVVFLSQESRSRSFHLHKLFSLISRLGHLWFLGSVHAWECCEYLLLSVSGPIKMFSGTRDSRLRK